MSNLAWLQARAERDDGKIDEKAMKALRRGWSRRSDIRFERLLDLMKKPSAKKSRASADPKAHGEAEVERIASEALVCLGLPTDQKELAKLRIGADGKVLVATLLRQLTTVGNLWIAQRLEMGHPGR